MIKEIWKPVPIARYDEVYEVSNYGQVRRTVNRHGNPCGKVLAVRLDVKRYVHVYLFYNSKPQPAKVHRMVAMCFVPNPNNYPQVNHKDGNKQNNHCDNLEWVTNDMNMKHAVEHGLRARAAANKRTKLTEEQVLQIRHLYKRNSSTHGTTALARLYGVSAEAISNIVHRITWRHLD